MFKALLALGVSLGCAAGADEPSCDRSFEHDESVSPYVRNLICRELTTEPQLFEHCRTRGRFRTVGAVTEFEIIGLATGRARISDSGSGAKTPEVTLFDLD